MGTSQFFQKWCRERRSIIGITILVTTIPEGVMDNQQSPFPIKVR
jgi:hypothetical protein